MAGFEVRGRGVCAALAIAVPVWLALAPQASSGEFVVGDFKYVKESVNLPAAGSMETTSNDVVPKCGAKWLATGGGANSKDIPGHTRLTTSGIGNDRSWFAEAAHLDSPKTKLVGYVQCIRDRVVESATEGEPVAAGPTSGTGEVICPSGLSVLGGGVRAIGAGSLWGINGSYPIDLGDADSIPEDGWRNYMLYGGGSPSSFLTDVICGEDLPEYNSKARDLPADALGGTAKAKCQGGHITGGGALISGPILEGTVVRSYPVDGKDGDKAPDDGWKVVANNIEGGDKTLTAYAICL